MSQYPVAPPSYGSSSSSPKPNADSAREPLLSASGSNSGAGGFHDQPEFGDLPDDFKVS